MQSVYCYVALRRGEVKLHTHISVIANPAGKRLFGKLRHRLQDYIKYFVKKKDIKVLSQSAG